MTSHHASGARRTLATVTLALAGVLTVAVGPASASTPSPAISSFKASPTSLSDAGGTVTFTGTFKYAETCVLSVSPAISGLPSSTTCTSDKYSKAVTVPKNTTGVAKDYTFSFYVKNTTGTTHAPNIVVAVGAAPPPITFTPTSVVFPAQGVGVASTPVSVEVTNNSTTASQDLTEFNLTGADTSDFQQNLSAGNCAVELSPGQSCDMSVEFQPQSGGSRTATFDVFDASWGTSGTEVPLKLSGTGEFATASVSTTDLVFPAEGVDVPTDSEPITVTNSGTVPLIIDGITVEGGNSADFSLLGNSCNGPDGTHAIISVGDTCTFLVQFDPSGDGSRTSEIVIGDNTAAATTDIPVSGTGAWSTSTLSTYSVDFGDVTVGQDAGVAVTITNTSSVALTFSTETTADGTGYTITGDNPEDFVYYDDTTVDSVEVACSDPGYVLDPGDSCQFSLAFDPVTVGPLSATFDLYDNTDNSSATPQYEQITLSGTGEEPS